MIYQLEDNNQNIESVIRSYEEKYDIFCLAQDSKGTVLYQSELAFPTEAETLLEKFNRQMDMQQTQTVTHSSMSEQNGIVEISGDFHEKYWGISATAISRNETLYHLVLIYKQASSFQILRKQFPIYLVLWFAALLSVIFLSRLLLKKTMQPTEQVLKSQKDFIASASHELKSPLAVILASAEQLERQTDNPSLKKTVNIIDSECMRMSRLVKDMLLLASSDAKAWTLCKSNVNVDTL